MMAPMPSYPISRPIHVTDRECLSRSVECLQIFYTDLDSSWLLAEWH
jgi:hypothetical protein